MVNERIKETLKKYADADGKLKITDDMPDDLKEAINYFNENNIDIFNTDFDNMAVDKLDDSEESEDLDSVPDEIEDEQLDLDGAEQSEDEEDLEDFL